MLDETLSARNKLHKFVVKVTKEKKASKESNTQPCRSIETPRYAYTRDSASCLPRDIDKMMRAVEAFNTLYDEVASLQAEAHVNGMSETLLGYMAEGKGT